MKRINSHTSKLLMIALIVFSLFSFSYAAAKDMPGDGKINAENNVREKSEILVKYKKNADEKAIRNGIKNKMGLSKLEVKKQYKSAKLDLISIEKGSDISEVIEELKKDPNVEYAQPNYKLEIMALPTDARFTEQWGLQNTGQEVEGKFGRSGVDINAANAWNITKGSSGVVIGVLDTGIDINHNDLKNSIYKNTREIPGNGIDDDNNGYVDDVNGWDFINADNTVYDSPSLDLHGTHVAGIIAAMSNADGITGVAPNVKILPLKFIHGNWGYTCDAIDAIEYAMAAGVKIINCSFGGTDNNFALKDTMVNSGILFVCAGGNRAADVSMSPVYPACFDIPNVLSVASIDSNGVLSPYSSYGSKIHVAAPGINILSTTPGNTFDYQSGTSASAPFVTGTAALVKSQFPNLTYAQVAQRIKDNVVPCTNLAGKVSTGGRVNANAALTNVKPAADTYTGPGNDDGTVPGGQQGGNEDTWYTQDQLARIKERMHYGESGVNPASGNYSFTCNDLSIPAPGFMVNISRTYNSRDDINPLIGQGWTFGFEGYVRGTNVVDVSLPNGGSQRFRLENGVYVPEDSRSVLAKNADGTYVLTAKDQYKYYFNTNGRLNKMEDSNGNVLTISFDTNGKINAITDTVGRTYTINYNTTNGYIDNIVCPENRVISYKYDASNRLTEVKDAMNNLMKYSYDTWGFITEIKDHYGKQITKITYNHNEGENRHKVSQAIDALGDVVNYSYDTTNKKTTITDINNRVSTYWYDSSMYTTRVQDPDAKSTHTEYFLTGGKNKYGDVKSVIDRNGNKTEYEIDNRGNVIKTINPDGSSRIYSYDDKNNLILEKDELDNQTFYIYDTNKKLLLKKAQPLNGTDVYSQGCDETKFAVTQYTYYTAAEAKAQFNCNAGGLLKSISDPEGNITSYTYDADGNIKTETDPEGKMTAYLYNRIGQKTRETTPRGYNTDYVYDKNGLLEKTILNDGETTRIVYDANGRKIQEVWPGQYDPAKDDMINHKYNDAGAGFRYTYFDSGMAKTITDPLNNTTSFTYDVYGNKLTEIKPNGAVCRYEYDNMDRLTKVFFKDSAASFEFILYEYSYAVLSDGKTQNTEIKHINDGLKASAVYIYDYADRLVERQNPDGTKETSTYKPNGLLETSTNVDGSITYFKYDALNRLTEQWTPFETSSQGILYTYTKIEYDKAGYKKAEKAGKGKVALFEAPSGFVTTSYAYYRNGLLKSAADSAGRRTEYQYDDDGNMSREDVYVSAENMKTKEYSYNHLNKAVEQKLHAGAKDIFGNSFDSTDEKILLTSYSYDKNGNLKTVTDPRMVTTSYTYDHLNRLLSESKPGTDENGTPVTIMTSMTYDWEGKPLTIKDANDNTAFYEYDKRGFLTRVTDAEGGITLYAYDRAGRKLSEVSPKNYDSARTIDEMNRVEYVYDIMSRILQKIDIYKEPSSGSWIRVNTKNLEYDNRGNVIKESDALGYEQDYGTEYTYNLAGKPVTSIDPVTWQRGLPFTIKYEYDSLGRKISETNAKGAETLYFYDDAGNLLTVKVKKNSYSEEKTLRTNTYDLAGRLLTETDGNGHTTTYEYNALDKVRKAITPDDSTIESNIFIYQYDENANTRLKKNSVGRIEEYAYDNQNRMISYTSKKADGTQAIITSARYDRNGNKRFETDGNGVTRENLFDRLNRLIETKTTVNGIEKSASYAYDANGNQTEMTDWLGNVYTNIYDPLNRLIEKQDPYTTIQTLEYNKNNFQSKSYDALGNMTQFSYDRNGRLIYTIDAEDHVTTQSYDDLGNIEAKTDGRGISIVYEYDEFNNLTVVTNAKGERTEYTYDLNGNMLTQKDAKGNTTTYEYNAANKVIRRIDHGGRTGQAGRYVYINDKVESFTYYPDGNMKAKKDRKGQITNYTYDIHGRLTEESIGSESVSYTYDGNGNELTMTDGTGTTERTYDEENRVLTKTVPHMGISTYQYDMTEAEGCHAEISTDPKGNETKKVYDRAGRLIKVISNAKETTFTYYGNGSRKSVEYPEGAKEEYTYYKDNLVKTLVNQKADGTIIDSYSYKYDAAHNQIEKQDKKGMTNYDYDSLNRLEKVTEPDGKITEYIFDMAGNRIQETITQGSETIATTYEYNEQNRLTNTITRNGALTETTKYEYDPNGNTMTKAVETTKPVDPNLTGSFAFNKAGQSTKKTITYYEYDSWNQLIKTIEGDKTIIAAYNGDGQRVEKTINGDTQRYLYEYDKVVMETDGQGNETARNIYGTNLLVREAENETAYYMYNGHGDVTALLNEQGNIIGSYYYDAFGNITEETGEADNPYRYAGYRYDEETGIYYLNSRYYDPKIARFLTEDTYRGQMYDPLSLNLYTYCHNEPIMYYDPSGHWAVGDSERSAAAQAQILEATKEYSDAAERGDKAAMNAAHQKAEDARAGNIYNKGNVDTKAIAKEIDEISKSKHVTKEAKSDLNKSDVSYIATKTSNKIEKEQQKGIINSINSARKSSNIVEPKAVGTIGLGYTPRISVVSLSPIGLSPIVPKGVYNSSIDKYGNPIVYDKYGKQVDPDVVYLMNKSPFLDGVSSGMSGTSMGLVDMTQYPEQWMKELYYQGYEMGQTAGTVINTKIMIDLASSYTKSLEQQGNTISNNLTNQENAALKATTNNIPSSRAELHQDLLNKGYRCNGTSEGGYVTYMRNDGMRVDIRPNGEIITTVKQWLPDGSKKIPVRLQYDGTPVPNAGHNTGEFVEAIGPGTFLPPKPNQ